MRSNPNFFGYVRISHENQEGNDSKENQIEELKRYGVPEEQIYTEIRSGADPDSEVLDELVLDENVMRKGVTFFVTTVDRLARSVSFVLYFVGRLQCCGASFRSTKWSASLNSTKKKDYIRLVSEAFEAEEELHDNRSRKKEGMILAKSSGKCLGRPEKLNKTGQQRFVREWRIDPSLKHLQSQFPTLHRSTIWRKKRRMAAREEARARRL